MFKIIVIQSITKQVDELESVLYTALPKILEERCKSSHSPNNDEY